MKATLLYSQYQAACQWWRQWPLKHMYTTV